MNDERHQNPEEQEESTDESQERAESGMEGDGSEPQGNDRPDIDLTETGG